MQSGSPDLFKLNSPLPVRHSRLRLIEWLIAVMFIVTLLIGSGVFFQVSNAADNRLRVQSAKKLKSSAIAPGTIGMMSVVKNESKQLKPGLVNAMDDTSCELKL